jgi:hypothetical protein
MVNARLVLDGASALAFDPLFSKASATGLRAEAAPNPLITSGESYNHRSI